MQVTIELGKLRALEADLANTQQHLQQTQQMLLTVIYALPGHRVSLSPADFENLPDVPQAWQTVDAEGNVAIEVADSQEGADHGPQE
jgi:hypothetical protein